MYETLVTKEEMMKASDLGDIIKLKDSRGLIQKYFSDGNTNIKMPDEYTFSNTKNLIKELINLLLSLPEVKMHLNLNQIIREL